MTSLSVTAADSPSGTSQTPSQTAAASDRDHYDHKGEHHGDHKSQQAEIAVKVQSSETFAKAAAQGGMTEVEVSKLALSKSTDTEVKSFAQRMVNDHGKANDELKSLAKAKGITLPTGLDAEHRAKVDKLTGKSGKAFDAAYSEAMHKDHAKTVALFRAASTANGVDKDFQAFAKKTLPTLEDHSQQATRLAGTHVDGSRNAAASASTAADSDKSY